MPAVLSKFFYSEYEVFLAEFDYLKEGHTAGLRRNELVATFGKKEWAERSEHFNKSENFVEELKKK